MITLGVDVAALALVGLLCVLLVTAWCATAGMPEEEGEAAVVASSATVIVMLVGYVVIARVLDMMVVYM